MPGTGEVKLQSGTRENPTAGYRSRFSHKNEIAQPGYYSVVLDDYKVKAELTATERAGFHKYTFPASDSSHFILDLTHIYGKGSKILDAEVKVLDNSTIVGGRRTDAWSKGRHMYFVMKFSKPAKSINLYSNDAAQTARELTGKSLKAAVSFDTKEGDVIMVKVGLSGVSVEGAMKNLDKEIPAWNFDAVRKAAHDAWQKELSKITVETANTKAREIFYTAYYHTLVAPTLYDDVDGQYRGMDLKVHQAPKGSHNYSTYSLWDTYRALNPLDTIVQPERVPALIGGLVRMMEESPAGAPVWPLQGWETGCMTGYHSAVVIAEACVKGFPGIDCKKAYELLSKRADQDDYRGLGYYRKLGYIPSDKEPEAATKTLEYSYDDWAMSQLASFIGDKADAERLAKRSANYRNLWDPKTGFIRPKHEDGTMPEPFDPTATGVSKKWRDFTESNSWQGTWGAQQDPAGYIELLGGKDKFVKKLDELFTVNVEIKGERPADMTGLVGMYAHGNEPSHHVAYLYDWAGAAWKTQERVRDLLDTQYNNDPNGLSGNEDCGQMSAWYVISALGFYAVDPAGGTYVLGSPLFEKVTLTVAGGKKLVIEAKNNSAANKYVQSVSFNGKPLDRVWFRHSEIAKGGSLVFQMGPQPNKNFGAADSALPPSLSKK